MLARALGKTHSELLRTTSAAELAEWLAFYRLEQALQEERAADAELERNAEEGTREIRRRLRGDA